MDFPGPASAAGKRRPEGRRAKENVRRRTLQYVELIFRVQRGRRGNLLRVAALLAVQGSPSVANPLGGQRVHWTRCLFRLARGRTTTWQGLF
jgi:hypothetical protein